MKTDRTAYRILSDGKRILIPYVCFGVISILIYAVLGELAASRFSMDVNTTVPYNLLGLAYAACYRGFLQFNAPLWFLPCLFAVKLMYYAMDKLTGGNCLGTFLLSIPLAAAGFVYSGFGLPMLPFSLSVAAKMAAFFAMGAVFAKYAPIGRDLEYRKGTVLAAGALCLGAALILGHLFPKVNYSSDTFPEVFAFCAAAIPGCAGIVFLAMGIRQNRPLEYIGKNTLAILVMHKFPVLFFQIFGPFKWVLEQHETFGSAMCCLWISAVSVLLCLLAAAIIKRICPFVLGLPGHKG